MALTLAPKNPVLTLVLMDACTYIHRHTDTHTKNKNEILNLRSWKPLAISWTTYEKMLVHKSSYVVWIFGFLVTETMAENQRTQTCSCLWEVAYDFPSAILLKIQITMISVECCHWTDSLFRSSGSSILTIVLFDLFMTLVVILNWCY